MNTNNGFMFPVLSDLVDSKWCPRDRMCCIVNSGHWICLGETVVLKNFPEIWKVAYFID